MVRYTVYTKTYILGIQAARYVYLRERAFDKRQKYNIWQSLFCCSPTTHTIRGVAAARRPVEFQGVQIEAKNPRIPELGKTYKKKV